MNETSVEDGVTSPGRTTREAILCIKVASRGDLLLASPAFRRLRQTRPGAHITLIVGASCVDVASHLPYFDEVRVIDDAALFSASVARRAVAAVNLLRTARNPSVAGRARRFDEVFIFHRDWRYGALARMAGIRRRRGFAVDRRGLLTHPYEPRPRQHDIGQYLGMVGVPVAAGGDVRLQPAVDGEYLPPLSGVWRSHPGERETALALAAEHGFDPDVGTWIGLGFGGGRNVKTHTQLKSWPLDHYRILAEELEGCGLRVVWLGDHHDAQQLTGATKGVNLAGQMTVAETAAILGMCATVVANDTLLLHLAEAVSVPTIALFGPTDPAHYGPLGARSRYLWRGESLECSPCHKDGALPPCAFDHRCMRELSVESVYRAVEEQIAGSSKVGGHSLEPR